MAGTPCTPIPRPSSRTQRKAEIRARSHAARAGLSRRGATRPPPTPRPRLLQLVGEHVAVGAHEIEVIPQGYDVSWLCRFSVPTTYPTPNCRASSAGSVVGLWQ